MKSVLVTVTEQYTGLYRASGSKFHSSLFPAETKEEFDRILAVIRQEYPLATHYCYAWRTGCITPSEFSSDDGEPSGTAGLPILNTLRSSELTNCGVIVVRYYGGTPLGKSGLIEAYGEATKQAINNALLIELRPAFTFRIEYPYDLQNLIDKWKHNYELVEKAVEYAETVMLTVNCPKPLADAFALELISRSHQLFSIEELGNSFELKNESTKKK